MSLRDQDNVKDNPLRENMIRTVKDCVGKVGQCDVVTNPLNNRLYKNLMINSYSDFQMLADKNDGSGTKLISDIPLKQNRSDESKPVILSKLDFKDILKGAPAQEPAEKKEEVVTPQKDTVVEAQTSPKDSDTFSEALIVIINKLDSIEKMLKDCKQ